MRGHKNKKIEQAKDSLDDILKRIGPYMPKTPKEEPTKERQWKMSKDITCPHLPEHNQVTSPF
jgi:hypothetical protein